ncbi:TerD family protein [Bacteroides stercorirosoris]|jgi:tellurium resistance protein TerD|uniref:TerD family protein n=1 Tax=Bacteroides stercorirosoris TaxID=871324 RepID=UPI0023F6D126|nr:TerD family protein [Bacteroides stercorirosoris]
MNRPVRGIFWRNFYDMAIRLEKGENHSLDLNSFCVGLGWDIKEDNSSDSDFDLDVSAFMIGEHKKVVSDDYLVFYNSEKRVRPQNLNKVVSYLEWSSNELMRHESRPVDPELSVIGSIDDEDGATSEDGDDETMDINLSRVSPEVQEIIICVSIFEYRERKQNFGQVERAYVRLYKKGQEEGDGEYIYDLTEDFSTCASVEFCRLYRKDDGWKIQALGIGHKGGLEELVNKYV